MPLLIASLPARSVGAARRDADAAARAGADLAEIRFDRWPPTERARAGELFPSPLPLLATLRSTAEGGEGPNDAAARSTWLASVLQLPFAWVDVEQARDPVPPASDGRPVTFVVSSHLAAGAPWPEVVGRLRAALPPHAVPKVVVPAPVAVVLESLVPSLPPPGEGRRIVLTTGPSGPLLRAWSRRLEMAAVYGSLPGSDRPAVEASQLPVDRLRRYLEAQPAPPLFAVVGRPIAHTRSPHFHHFWMDRHGRPGLYLALELASDEELARAIPGLVDGGFRGLNVTHPFKEAAARLATSSGPGVAACGCANTLTFRDGEVEAENTDLLAVLRRLEELRAADRWDGRELAVVGTGGAARAALAAGRELGARAVLLGRDRTRTEALAREFGADTATGRASEPASLLVHATPVGRKGAGPLAVPLGPWLGPRSVVLDFVYAAEDHSLAELARARGASYEDGTRLLAFAAAASYEIWWGNRPSPDEIEAALEAG